MKAIGGVAAVYLSNEAERLEVLWFTHHQFNINDPCCTVVVVVVMDQYRCRHPITSLKPKLHNATEVTLLGSR